MAARFESPLTAWLQLQVHKATVRTDAACRHARSVVLQWGWLFETTSITAVMNAMRVAADTVAAGADAVDAGELATGCEAVLAAVADSGVDVGNDRGRPGTSWHTRSQSLSNMLVMTAIATRAHLA